MTNKSLTTCFLSPVLVFGFFLVLSSNSQAYQATRVPGTLPADKNQAHIKTTPGAKNETYSVIQIGEDIKVITSTEKANLKKKAEDDYKSDLKKYTDAKKDKKNADANSLKKPDRKDYDVKVFPKTFKTQEDAQKFADDKIKERDKGSNTKKTTGSTW